MQSWGKTGLGITKKMKVKHTLHRNTGGNVGLQSSAGRNMKPSPSASHASHEGCGVQAGCKVDAGRVQAG